ncbi:MAG: LPS assembly protein LptD [Moraxella sp.]|nr:LPS assembly protein LptD [Moraxella sp.]
MTHAIFQSAKPLAISIRLAFFGMGILPMMSLADSQSLQRLAEHYHTKPSADARCHGEWISPKSATLTQTLGDNGIPDSIYAQADYGYWDNQDYAELSGNVIIEQQGQQISADKIIYHPSTGEAIAEGGVLFSNPNDGEGLGAGIIGVAQKMQYSDNQTAHAQDVAFASTTIKAHGHAKQLKQVSDSHYQMSGVMFTTCPPNERKWHLDADSIDLNTDTGRGIAKNSTLKIGDTPIFYLPYFNFPIDDRRSSGFLLPSAGFGSHGVQFSTPYYLNLAPNYDATITPTVFSSKNPMLTGEFRYLTRQYGTGTLTGSYLPHDRKYDKQDRKRFSYQHLWSSQQIPHLSAYANYHYVSDKDYLSDFDTLGLHHNPLNLPRNIGASYYNDHIRADLRAEVFQKLNGTNNDGTPITDKDRPYARLPQLSVDYSLPKISRFIDNTRFDNIHFQGTHHSAYFKKSIKDNSETEKSGVRVYNQFSASYPIEKTWGYITPKIALNHLYASYDEDSLSGLGLTKEEGTYSVFAPTVGLDMGLFFEKQGSPFGRYDDSLGGYQLITPRLKYTYTPYKNQEKIPNFDTAISTISYEQLLSDSWFLGYDRIQDLHAITPAIGYRYVNKNGLTRFDGGIAEQFLIEDTKVGINNSQAFMGKNTGTAYQASTQPKENLWVDVAGSFKSNYDLNSLIAQVRYQPSEHSLFNVGMIKRKEHKSTGQLAMSAYTASAVFPINHRWQLLSQAQYDYKNDYLLDALVGLNYEDCCYGLSVYARRYRNDLDPTRSHNAVMAEIRLNGISTKGRLNNLMSDKVLGYDHAQNAWQHAY